MDFTYRSNSTLSLYTCR